MKRTQELDMIREEIKSHFECGNCGLYNCRNWAGDPMYTIFNGDYFQLDICYFYSYFEVFGTTNEEFSELKKFYELLEKEEELNEESN